MRPSHLDSGPHPTGDGFCLIEAAAQAGGFAGGDNPSEIAGFIRTLGRRLNDAVDDATRQSFLPYVGDIAQARNSDAVYAERALIWLFEGPIATRLRQDCGSDIAPASGHYHRRLKELRAAERIPTSDKGRAKKIKEAQDNYHAAIGQIREVVEAVEAFEQASGHGSTEGHDAEQARLVQAGSSCGIEIELDLDRPVASRSELVFHLAALSYVPESPLSSCWAIARTATHPDSISDHPPDQLLGALLK